MAKLIISNGFNVIADLDILFCEVSTPKVHPSIFCLNSPELFSKLIRNSRTLRGAFRTQAKKLIFERWGAGFTDIWIFNITTTKKY